MLLLLQIICGPVVPTTCPAGAPGSGSVSTVGNGGNPFIYNTSAGGLLLRAWNCKSELCNANVCLGRCALHVHQTDRCCRQTEQESWWELCAGRLLC